MQISHLLKVCYKTTEEIVLAYLSRAAHDKKEHLCILATDKDAITASIKELGYFSRHKAMQPSIDLIADIQDQIGQHLLLRFGLPKENEKPRKILFVILPGIFNKLGFVSTGKMIKHCKGDRRIGSIVVVNFDVIGR